MTSRREHGFTLIEISIVLVIIGLIVGGVLAGQNLIRAAAVRAQVSQIEKFNTAANTFFGKYGYLPGDIPAGPAAQFGFVARAGTVARGDGNGEIEGACYGCGSPAYGWDQDGETLFFWEDISSAGLIEGSFNTAADADIGYTTSFRPYFPEAKLGNGNYIYVWSGGGATPGGPGAGNSLNYFGISVPQSINSGNMLSNPGLTVSQAYNIDLKIDDGLPTQGKITANYVGGAGGQGIIWAPSAGSASTATCYDTTSKQYSVMINNGAGVNCGLSFQMQAGD